MKLPVITSLADHFDVPSSTDCLTAFMWPPCDFLSTLNTLLHDQPTSNSQTRCDVRRSDSEQVLSCLDIQQIYIYVNCVQSCAQLVDYKTRKILRLRIEVKPTALLHHAHKLWPLAMTLTYNPKWTIMIVTFTHKTQVQRWVGSKDRVEINGRTGDGRISTHADPTSTRRTTMCSGAKG